MLKTQTRVRGNAPLTENTLIIISLNCGRSEGNVSLSQLSRAGAVCVCVCVCQLCFADFMEYTVLLSNGTLSFNHLS